MARRYLHGLPGIFLEQDGFAFGLQLVASFLFIDYRFLHGAAAFLLSVLRPVLPRNSAVLHTFALVSEWLPGTLALLLSHSDDYFSASVAFFQIADSLRDFTQAVTLVG